MADNLLRQIFIKFCKGYKQNDTDLMQRPHFHEFIDTLDFVDLAESDLNRIYDGLIPTQKDITRAKHGIMIRPVFFF